jgi:general secretion pathway protein H
MDSRVLLKRRTPDIAGFTLLEMMVVVAILGVLAMVALPRLQLGRGPRLRAAAHAVAADLRLLRDDAIRRSSPAALEATATGYLLRPSGRARALPAGLTLETAAGASTLLPSAGAEIAFFPDGSSSGGVVSLRASGGGAARIVVRGLDGRVRLDE